MTTLRTISMLALSVLTLATCATVPDLTEWTPCTDGTYCPAGTQCSTDGASCLLSEVCGDGTRTPSEECDDGNLRNGDGCNAHCTLAEPLCGDCIISGGEECDDGNQNDGDGCDSNCRLSPDMPAAADTFCPGRGRTQSELPL